jgi:DNA-binding SARP family transcriptional activator
MLELAATVTTDVDRFVALASTNDPSELVHAMELVRGAPFSGLRHGDWAVFDGTQAEVEDVVVQAALRGADRLLAQDRAAEAERVIRKALLVRRFDERLYRALLRATHAHGDRVRLRCTMAELVHMAEVGSSWTNGSSHRSAATRLGVLHPETAAVYRDLLMMAPAPGTPPTRQ